MLRTETKARARALQILYAWELQDRPPIGEVVRGLEAVHVRCGDQLAGAGALAAGVAVAAGQLDGEIREAAEHWRLERIGMIERNILRIGLYELLGDSVPPRVAINEAVRLAHWFAGAQAPAFVNGVLDGLARRGGRL